MNQLKQVTTCIDFTYLAGNDSGSDANSLIAIAIAAGYPGRRVRISVLITGGAGYIGSHTCAELLRATHAVVVFDKFSNSHPEAPLRAAQIVGKRPLLAPGDIRDQSAIEVTLRGHQYQAVIHFAGLKAVDESVEKPTLYYYHDMVAPHRLLTAIQNCGVQTLVFSSSATVYGEPQRPPLTEDRPLPAKSPYGHTKLIIEDMLCDPLRTISNWRIAILRYFNPIGAHKSGLIAHPQGIPNNFLPYVAQVVVGRREALDFWGNDYPPPDETGVRDFIHAVDSALGHLKALERIEPPQCLAVNLGTSDGYSVVDAVRALEATNCQSTLYIASPRRSSNVAACSPLCRPWLGRPSIRYKSQARPRRHVQRPLTLARAKPIGLRMTPQVPNYIGGAR